MSASLRGLLFIELVHTVLLIFHRYGMLSFVQEVQRLRGCTAILVVGSLRLARILLIP